MASLGLMALDCVIVCKNITYRGGREGSVWTKSSRSKEVQEDLHNRKTFSGRHFKVDSLARHIWVYSQGGRKEEKTQSPLLVSAASGVCASSPNKAFLRPHLFFAHSTAIFLSNILHILFILYIFCIKYIVVAHCVAHYNIKVKQPGAVISLYILYPISIHPLYQVFSPVL